MTTIAVAGSKGGVGKSMISTMLAVAIALEFPEARVGLIDADPQGTSAAWWGKRGQTDIELFASDGLNLEEDAADLRKDGVDHLVIDTPPGLSRFQQGALAAADIVIIPTGPCFVDLEAILHTEAMAREAGKVPYFVLNRAGFRTRLAGAAVRHLRESGRQLLPAVHQRVEIAEAMEAGLVATETAPWGAAAAELTAMWGEVRALMRPAPRPPGLRSLVRMVPA